MNRYRVGVLELWRRDMILEAESPQGAVERILEAIHNNEEESSDLQEETFTLLDYPDVPLWRVESLYAEEVAEKALSIVMILHAGDKLGATKEATDFVNWMLRHADGN